MHDDAIAMDAAHTMCQQLQLSHDLQERGSTWGETDMGKGIVCIQAAFTGPTAAPDACLLVDTVARNRNQ
jgi:hypothetical protein